MAPPRKRKLREHNRRQARVWARAAEASAQTAVVATLPLACAHKKAYASMAAATGALSLIRQQFPGDTCAAYHCRGCGHYHVGHNAPRAMHNG